MNYSVADVVSYLSQGRPGGVEAISSAIRYTVSRRRVRLIGVAQ